MTHTYIKPSSNQRSTTARVASAAGRLRSSRLSGNWLPAHSHLPKMQSIFSLAVRRQRMYAGREHRRSRAGELKMD